MPEYRLDYIPDSAEEIERILDLKRRGDNSLSLEVRNPYTFELIRMYIYQSSMHKDYRYQVGGVVYDNLNMAYKKWMQLCLSP
jgi:hypothetical protein